MKEHSNTTKGYEYANSPQEMGQGRIHHVKFSIKRRE